MNNSNKIDQQPIEQNETNNVIQFKTNAPINYELLKNVCTQIQNGADSQNLITNMYEKFPEHHGELNQYIKEHTQLNKPDINKIHKKFTEQKKYKNEPKNLTEWIKKYFDKHKTHVSASNDITIYGKYVDDPKKTDNENLILRAEHKTKNDSGLTIFINKMFTELTTTGLNKKYDCDYQQFMRQFEIVRDELKSKKRNEITRNVLAESTEIPWKKWKNIAGIISDDNQNYVAALLYHHIWMTKRRMVDLPISHHTMPIFYAGQGSGKTTFVNIFTKPIAELTAPSTWKDVLGKQSHDLYRNYFVLFLDEMVGTGGADIDSMKTFLTTKYQTSRPLYTNSTEQIEINPTIIATTNQPVCDLIRDPTGNRRFAEIEYGTAEYHAPYQNQEFSKIDWLKIWQSVDATSESIFDRDVNLYNLVFNGVMREKSYRTPFEKFMNNRNVEITKGHEYSADALYERFNIFYEKGNFNRDTLDITKFKFQLGKFITTKQNETGFIRKTGHARKKTYSWENEPDMFNYDQYNIVGNGV